MIIRYFGKIHSVIGQHGFFAGIRVLIIALSMLLRRPVSANILFVSSGAIGDSWRYRVKNVSEELEKHGFSVSVVVQENFWLDSCADKFSVFIFHRVQKNPAVLNLIEKIKALEKEIIFETDDLVFDFELVKKQDFYLQSNESEKEFYKQLAKDSLLNDQYVKVCTTTTGFLANRLQERSKNVFVLPNRLSKRDVDVAERILEQKHSAPSLSKSVIKIGYFSGTSSHNKDFETITNALMWIMEKHENVELFLAGPLSTENVLNKFASRIKKIPYVPREKHFENLANIDINVAPLEIGNPFCESKSELKFFEAAIVDVPTVAAATQPFVQAIQDGIDGFVANGYEQWIEKLERLIVDEKLRKSMGQKAHQKALEQYTIENSNNEEYYNYLRSKL